MSKYHSAEIWEKIKKARRYGKICKISKISKTRRYGKITRRYRKMSKYHSAEIWENNAEIWENIIFGRGDMGKYVKNHKRGDMGK
jgi:hypothetical protein